MRVFGDGYTQTQCDYGKAGHEYAVRTGIEGGLAEAFRQGYQARIRDVFWQFVEQLMGSGGAQSASLELRRLCDGAVSPTTARPHPLSWLELPATVEAMAQQTS